MNTDSAAPDKYVDALPRSVHELSVPVLPAACAGVTDTELPASAALGAVEVELARTPAGEHLLATHRSAELVSVSFGSVLRRR
jgi:hypothetical protein